MYKQSKLNEKHRSLDFIFILLLLCVFAFTSLLLIIFGANVYKGVADKMDQNFQLRTPLSYISTKVRQYDASGAIWLEEKENTTALVLETVDRGQPCQTWIYEYDNALCEVYIDKGANFALSDGIAMIPSHGLDLSLSETGLLKVRAYNENGIPLSVSLMLRSEKSKNGGESNDQ